jgi:hypothetical protein
MEKLAAKLPSSLASQNPGKTSPLMSKIDRRIETNGAQKIVDFRGETAGLTKAVVNSDCINLVPEGGLEPPCG